MPIHDACPFVLNSGMPRAVSRSVSRAQDTQRPVTRTSSAGNRFILVDEIWQNQPMRPPEKDARPSVRRVSRIPLGFLLISCSLPAFYNLYRRGSREGLGNFTPGV